MIPSPLHGQIPFHSAPTILSRQRASDCGLCPGGSPGFRTGLIFRLLESSFGEREAEGHFGTGEKGVLEPDQFFAGAGFGCYRKGLGGQMLDNVTQGDSSLCWWDSWGSDLSYISVGPLCTAVCRVRKSPSSPKPTTASPLLSQACGKGLPVEELPAPGTSSVDPDRSPSLTHRPVPWDLRCWEDAQEPPSSTVQQQLKSSLLHCYGNPLAQASPLCCPSAKPAADLQGGGGVVGWSDGTVSHPLPVSIFLLC